MKVYKKIKKKLNLVCSFYYFVYNNIVKNSKMNKLFYIGLNGLAGSGKDTVARMLKTILIKDWENLDQCKEYYQNRYKGKVVPATFNNEEEEHFPVMCIAFADQLKHICATIFGIPVARFYNNKENAWICINKDFQYTEIKPLDEYIVNAEDYYTSINIYKESQDKYWMSLREILVYIGTYVCQADINKNIFVNIVTNTIKEKQYENKSLKYIICTDVRFGHELEYVHNKNGITIKIIRDSVSQMTNIAEHDLDYEDGYDYIIENNGTYDELFETVWNIVKYNKEFNNITKDLATRDNIDNYIRLIDENDKYLSYKVCSPYHINKLERSAGNIVMIDLIGGPEIYVGSYIPGTNIICDEIYFEENQNSFILTSVKK